MKKRVFFLCKMKKENKVIKCNGYSKPDLLKSSHQPRIKKVNKLLLTSSEKTLTEFRVGGIRWAAEGVVGQSSVAWSWRSDQIVDFSCRTLLKFETPTIQFRKLQLNLVN